MSKVTNEDDNNINNDTNKSSGTNSNLTEINNHATNSEKDIGRVSHSLPVPMPSSSAVPVSTMTATPATGPSTSPQNSSPYLSHYGYQTNANYPSVPYLAPSLSYNNYFNSRVPNQPFDHQLNSNTINQSVQGSTGISDTTSIPQNPSQMQQHQSQSQSQQHFTQSSVPSEENLNYIFKVGGSKSKVDEYSRKFNSKKIKDIQSRPYVCSFPGCEWAFARQSDLRRHAKSHAEPMFHCPYWRNDPTCHRNGGAFNRLDVLKRHLRLVHYIQDKQQIIPGSKEDPGWCRACQRMFSNSKQFIDHCTECALLLSPAEWKATGFQGQPTTDHQLQKSAANNTSPQNVNYDDNQRQQVESAAAAIYDLPKIGKNDDKENYFLNSDDGGDPSLTSPNNLSKRKNDLESETDSKRSKRD
ncbi:uncharacterized protein PRCAT00004202001 [Priceomyces carsonii]|uniref:uncharacterized protein n=1 Tax=Priceomyces carsonii TaxID=28549 RepID=UPI002ED8C278|nr:unnamed protein product [Priceomyces carsonii]